MSDSYAESSQTVTTFEVALEAAIAASISNVKNLTGLCNFNLSVTASAAELNHMYHERHHRYVNIASLCIPYTDHNGIVHRAPVTPLYGHVKDQTFHTITMCRTDGATVVVLVRDCDNYVVGFRIYMNEAEANNAPWLVFRGAELPPSLGNVVGIQYHFAYETIEDIKFEKNTLADIVEFLISFRTNPNQSTTVSGKLLIGSLFLLFGEAQRFCAARKWILCALLCSTPQNIPQNIADIFRKWSDLSKICLELYLAMLEKLYLGSSDGRINDALKNWKKVENANRSTVLKFRDLQNNIHLNCLLGGEVYLLKHDFEFCTRIVMLQLGYRKDLKIKKCNIKKVYAKSMANKF